MVLVAVLSAVMAASSLAWTSVYACLKSGLGSAHGDRVVYALYKTHVYLHLVVLRLHMLILGLPEAAGVDRVQGCKIIAERVLIAGGGAIAEPVRDVGGRMSETEVGEVHDGAEQDGLSTVRRGSGSSYVSIPVW